MAENESLDLGGAYSKRWDAPFDSVRKGSSCKDVAMKVETALYSGFRKALKQLHEYGVSLPDMLNQRDSRQALHKIIRKTQGHHYVQLFAAAAASSGGNPGECLRGWVDAVLDKMFDQICHQVAGKENWPTFYDVAEFTKEVRNALEPAVERIVTQLEKDPNWRPSRARSKGEERANPTEELLGMSLLGVAKP